MAFYMRKERDQPRVRSAFIHLRVAALCMAVESDHFPLHESPSIYLKFKLYIFNIYIYIFKNIIYN